MSKIHEFFWIEDGPIINYVNTFEYYIGAYCIAQTYKLCFEYMPIACST